RSRRRRTPSQRTIRLRSALTEAGARRLPRPRSRTHVLLPLPRCRLAEEAVLRRPERKRARIETAVAPEDVLLEQRFLRSVLSHLGDDRVDRLQVGRALRHQDAVLAADLVLRNRLDQSAGGGSRGKARAGVDECSIELPGLERDDQIRRDLVVPRRLRRIEL